ncbi:unnamed protein product [Adineta steineri]|uniref:Uncharacterized protein n=1 Tax=Adineta steineri TaxID=433720 RepID=A0A815EHB4_9BILA|nr:unnamed protein product [Adineta steineri]CAF3726532.1 unnamed protein product [Adineta steineri]
MSISSKQNDGEDQFESADEDESTLTSIIKSITPSRSNKIITSINQNQIQIASHSPVTDKWNDWNIDNDISLDKKIQTTTSTILEKDDSLFENNQIELNSRISRYDDELLSSTIVTKHNVKDAHFVLDRLAAQSSVHSPTWHTSWSHFGSFLSNAKQSVSTLTNTVSESFTAAIESAEAGLGALDAQQVAEMDRIAFKIKGETSDSEDEPETPNTQNDKMNFVTNQDGWFNALSLGKLTNTGMKVVSGSLNVLENVGKKTFDIINEADSDLKATRHLINQSTLSETVHEKELKSTIIKNEPVTFFQLLEKYQGLIHFEALELLSNQSTIILQTMNYENEKILEEISSYFQIGNNEQDIPTLDILSKNFTSYQTQLRSSISVDKLLEIYESASQFLKEYESMDTEFDQKTLSDNAIDFLAILCSSIIEYYHKTAELFLRGCQSLTSFSIDIELLSIYRKQQQDFSNMLTGISNLFVKHITDYKHNYNLKFLNQILLQSSTSQTYASNAYILLEPIISQSILYHTSTTR